MSLKDDTHAYLFDHMFAQVVKCWDKMAGIVARFFTIVFNSRRLIIGIELDK